MKELMASVGMILLGIGVWVAGNTMSSDSIGMGVGLIFGMLAGVPVALLVSHGVTVRTWEYMKHREQAEIDQLRLEVRRQNAELRELRAVRDALAVVRNGGAEVVRWQR